MNINVSVSTKNKQLISFCCYRTSHTRTYLHYEPDQGLYITVLAHINHILPTSSVAGLTVGYVLPPPAATHSPLIHCDVCASITRPCGVVILLVLA